MQYLAQMSLGYIVGNSDAGKKVKMYQITLRL
jgi:hypothetical protein